MTIKIYEKKKEKEFPEDILIRESQIEDAKL